MENFFVCAGSMATKTWDNIQSQIKDPMTNSFSPNKLKKFLFDICLKSVKTKASLLLLAYSMDNISFDCFFVLLLFLFLFILK